MAYGTYLPRRKILYTIGYDWTCVNLNRIYLLDILNDQVRIASVYVPFVRDIATKI